jgi:hypothetical protein
MLQNSVYLLCFATCVLCAVMLGRGYLRTRTRLLMWSCLCFIFLSLNNLLLVADVVLFPADDYAFAGVTFAVLRSSAALIGLLLLLIGLIWDSK